MIRRGGSLFSDVDMESSEYLYYDTLGKISAELVNYRIKHGLSQADLAKILGVTQAMVSKYESGDYNISLKTTIELFSKLGVFFSFNIGLGVKTVVNQLKPLYIEALPDINTNM